MTMLILLLVVWILPVERTRKEYTDVLRIMAAELLLEAIVIMPFIWY